MHTMDLAEFATLDAAPGFDVARIEAALEANLRGNTSLLYGIDAAHGTLEIYGDRFFAEEGQLGFSATGMSSSWVAVGVAMTTPS